MKHETDMPHCWCNPEKRVLEGGNIHIIHKKDTYEEYMTKKSIVEVLKNEIDWCEKNPQDLSEEFRNGFVKGLKQAITLVESMNHD